MTWKKGKGDRGTYAFPDIPWHEPKMGALHPEHVTDVAYQPPLESLSLDGGYYYFYCSCGACGHGMMVRTHAGAEADLHLEAVSADGSA